MKLFVEYKKSRQKLFDYFGYTDNWCWIPIEDAQEYYWHLTGEGYGHKIRYAINKSILFKKTMNNKLFSQPWAQSYLTYTHHHLKKWVYRGADYTLIFMHKNMDGNNCLKIFENAKELPSN